MGQHSNGTQACIKNLQQHKGTKKPTVEDVPESDNEEYSPPSQKQTSDLLEEGFFFLDEDSDSDSDSEFGDEEVEEDELKELRTEADLFRFNSILAKAQAVAIQAEKEATESKPKRKRHYTGNSAHTIRHYAQKHCQLQANGQSLINSWFTKKEKSDPPILVHGPQPMEDVHEDIEQSEDEFEEPEIEKRVNRIFAVPTQVSKGPKKKVHYAYNSLTRMHQVRIAVTQLPIDCQIKKLKRL